MFRKNDDETSVWISNTDLMSGLMVIFLLIAISITGAYKNAEKALNQNMEAEKNIVASLNAEFTESEQEEVELNKKGLGSAYFPDSWGTFRVGSANLSPAFKEKLNIFFPKYIKAIYPHRDAISEIRIEGYTSSEWNNLPLEQAYFYNMKLSQDRTRAILDYVFSIPELYEYHEFMRKKITANGLSSRNLIETNGIENKEASRRIEFKIVTNDNNIIDALKKTKVEAPNGNKL